MFFFPALAINIDLIVFGFDTTDFFTFFLSFVDVLSPFPTKARLRLVRSQKYKLNKRVQLSVGAGELMELVKGYL